MTYTWLSSHVFSMSYTSHCLGKKKLGLSSVRFSYKLHNTKYSGERPSPRGGYINVTGCESGVVQLTASYHLNLPPASAYLLPTTATSPLSLHPFCPHPHHTPPLLVYLFLELDNKYKSRSTTCTRLSHHPSVSVNRDVSCSADDVGGSSSG